MANRHDQFFDGVRPLSRNQFGFLLLRNSPLEVYALQDVDDRTRQHGVVNGFFFDDEVFDIVFHQLNGKLKVAIRRDKDNRRFQVMGAYTPNDFQAVVFRQVVFDDGDMDCGIGLQFGKSCRAALFPENVELLPLKFGKLLLRHGHVARVVLNEQDIDAVGCFHAVRGVN